VRRMREVGRFIGIDVGHYRRSRNVASHDPDIE
jgi:hypothetical protein